MREVRPASTVIAAAHPDELPAYDNLGNLAAVQVSLCDLMPFYSSLEAAQGWRAQHPHGWLSSVGEFWEFSQRVWVPAAGMAGHAASAPS